MFITCLLDQYITFDIDVSSLQKGKTLLHCAASVSGEEEDIVDVLMKRGVDLYAQDKVRSKYYCVIY